MSENQSIKLLEIAKKRNLLITGGSDFHYSTRDKLGCEKLTKNNVEKLKAKL